MAKSSCYLVMKSVDARDNGVYVDFKWQGDWFDHTIGMTQGDDRSPLWQSSNKHANCWPLFQHLYEQSDESGKSIAFLSGADEGAHWSMSVHESEAGVLLFDVAARVLKPPLEKTIRYQRAKASDEELIKLAAASPETVVEHDHGAVTVRPAHLGTELPATLRWTYMVRDGSSIISAVTSFPRTREPRG